MQSSILTLFSPLPLSPTSPLKRFFFPRHDFYIPWLYAVTSVRTAFVLLLFFWACLKIVQLIRNGAFRFKKLSVISLLLLLGAIISTFNDQK